MRNRWHGSLKGAAGPSYLPTLKVVGATYHGPHGRRLPSATAAVAAAGHEQVDIAQAARWLSALLDRDCEPHEGSRSLQRLRGRAVCASAAWLQALNVGRRSPCTSTELAVSGWRLQMGHVRHQRRCWRWFRVQQVLVWSPCKLSSRREFLWPPDLDLACSERVAGH